MGSGREETELLLSHTHLKLQRIILKILVVFAAAECPIKHAHLTSSRSRLCHLPSSGWSLCFSWYESCGIWDCLAACKKKKKEKKKSEMKWWWGSYTDRRGDTVRHPQTLLGQMPSLCLSPKQNKIAHTHPNTHTTIYRGVMEQPASKLQKNHLIKLLVLKELTN